MIFAMDLRFRLVAGKEWVARRRLIKMRKELL
jgi:hypothetical protein